MLLYAQLVSESYRPVVSSQKRSEMDTIIRNISHKPRKPNMSVFDKSKPMFIKKLRPSRSKNSNAYIQDNNDVHISEEEDLGEGLNKFSQSQSLAILPNEKKNSIMTCTPNIM